MKKSALIISSLLLVVLVVGVGQVGAEVKILNAATTAVKRPIVATKAANIKEQVVNRLKQSVDSRLSVFKRMITKIEALFPKLDTRIAKAKQAGQNTTEAEKLMADARAKIADAKAQLVKIEAKKGTANDKTSLKEVNGLFQLARKDIHQVITDVSQVIKSLKGFNSATSSGKNPQTEGTSPASR